MSASARADLPLFDLTGRIPEPLYIAAVAGGMITQLVGLWLASSAAAAAGLAVAAIAELATSDERPELRGRLRRVGLGVGVRAVLRGLMLVSAVGLAGASRPVVALYVIGVLALITGVRTYLFMLTRVIDAEPAVGGLNLADDLDLTSRFVRLRGQRTVGAGLLAGAELPLAAGLMIGSIEANVTTGLVLLAVTTVALAGIMVGTAVWTLRFLRSDRIERYVEGLKERVVETGAEVVVYFSADADASYQLKQWMPVLERLRRPVLLLLRERVHLDVLSPTRLPVLLCPRHSDVEVALALDPKVVLYVGNAGRNIHFLRYGRPKHVFLNHGDSDKISSANPVVKIYDQLYVAGQVAVERYRAAGIDLPDERFAIVGRPQLDQVLDGRRRIGDGPTTLLYAPTWEGYFEAADYSSLERMGVALVQRILESHPDLRIVFKPHPMSGAVRSRAVAEARRVTALLREAGAPHVVATDHPDLDLFAWFDRSDVLLSDISAVVTDYLHTDKPYLVTNPRGLDLDEFLTRFPSHRAAYVIGPDASDVDQRLTEALGDDPLAQARAAMKRAVLGDHEDGPLASFERALDHTIAWAKRDAARIRNTFAYE